MIEVLGDGTGARHRRYLVKAADREGAAKTIMLLLGANAAVTSTTVLSTKAAEVAALQPGEIKPLSDV